MQYILLYRRVAQAEAPRTSQLDYAGLHQLHVRPARRGVDPKSKS